MSNNNKWNSIKKKSAKARGTAFYDAIRVNRLNKKKEKKINSLKTRHIAREKRKNKPKGGSND